MKLTKRKQTAPADINICAITLDAPKPKPEPRRGPTGPPTNDNILISAAATPATVTIWLSQSCYVQTGVQLKYW